ncbi:hypothetical protein SEA_DAUDAU_27 [Streptomyces phage Daudau]|uniref:Uncharacterized protein n=1 Tax=Streptomyces phage Daudau TaxID=2041206 RepID=A0A291LH71_9CAUD|nr:hypothetical protein KGG88_gp27 [Streptomyces phage Daudau]ATI18728.1 hypothetical protein SEA_DAUDAU_27 [Streptomyces phage Daudau]
MSVAKHAAPTNKAVALVVTHLPTRYRSKTGLVTAALGVVVSVLSVVAVHRPEVAVAIQALTALGFVEQDGSDDSEE